MTPPTRPLDPRPPAAFPARRRPASEGAQIARPSGEAPGGRPALLGRGDVMELRYSGAVEGLQPLLGGAVGLARRVPQPLHQRRRLGARLLGAMAASASMPGIVCSSRCAQA